MFEEQRAAGIKQLIEHNPVTGEAKRGERRFWTYREQKILRKGYPQGGVAACLPFLQGRSAYAIYGMVRKLRLKCEYSPVGVRRRYAANEHFDAAIRRVYQGEPKRNAVNELCRWLQRAPMGLPPGAATWMRRAAV